MNLALDEHHRARFDALVGRAIERLPENVRAQLEFTPVIVLDVPTPEIRRELGLADDDLGLDICGLHTGVPATERSIEHSGVMPSQIHLFRLGILDLAGGWDAKRAERKIMREITITILHELGHEHGLDEDDLDRLGYG